MADTLAATLGPDSATVIREVRVLQTGIHWFASGSGGLDRVFCDLAAALPDCGVSVRGLVVSPAEVSAHTGGQISCFSEAGAGLVRRLLSARAAIGQRADDGSFDVLAPHFALHVATVLDRLRRVPIVAHFHGPWAMEARAEGAGLLTSRARHAVESAVYRRADRLIVLSDAFRRVLIEQYRVPDDRIRVIPGAIRLDRFARLPELRTAREILGWPADRPIVLSVRRLAARMGLERLIDAVSIVRRTVPDILLLIAGRGRLQVSLQARISAAGLERHVRLVGFVPDDLLPTAYAAADLHVVPSQSLEGFGLSAAEAFAAGTPCLVTPVGGLPELAAGLSPALVMASTRTEAMADALTGALRGGIALPDAHACRAYARARFDLGRAASATASVYREVARV